MNFNELNLKKNLQSNILESGFSDMTEIQQNIIPKILDGVDIIGQAPTGTGKTLAFAIPTINNIDPNNNNIQVIALCPTRELTIQVGDEYKKLCKNLNINILTIYGGQPIDKQIRYLNQSKPQIIVSTPGRLLDHIKRNSINVKTITSIILDEADVMLDMGFGRDVDRIFQTIQNKHQTILISATIPEQILSLSKKYQSNPFLHKVHMTEESKPDIKQYFVLIKHNLKLEAIKQILKNNPFYLAMIFTNTKWEAKDISNELRNSEYKVASFQGNLKQSAREKILKDFRDGRINVLVATDIVARGIDIKGIDLVINYDAPKDLDYYVHRIGRTARAKTSGSSFTLFDPRKSFTIKNIERHTGIKLEEYKVEVDETKVTNLHGERREFTSERKEFNHEPRKERTVNENATRFFINIGTKDNLDQGSLKSLLVEKCNINANDILDVYMKDMFSFIEVNNSATSNLSNFNEYNGRSIRIDKSNERKPTGGHNNNSRGGERRFGGSRGGGFGDRNKSFGGPRKFSNHGFGDRNKSFHSDGHKKFGDKKRTFGSFKKEY